MAFTAAPSAFGFAPNFQVISRVSLRFFTKAARSAGFAARSWARSASAGAGPRFGLPTSALGRHAHGMARSTTSAPAVGIIMGSQSDWETMTHAADTLRLLEVVARAAADDARDRGATAPSDRDRPVELP